MLNPHLLQKDFPILQRKVNGRKLVYLDNASTTQKPKVVLDAIINYYQHMNANIHRGVHTLSEEATEAYEATRKMVADFVGTKDEAEIIFTRNATEALNLVAYSYGEQHVSPGDAVVVSELEHHSNLVPWQQLCRRKGAELRVIPMTDEGILNLEDLEKIIDEKVKIVAVTQMSNVLGTIVPLKKIIDAAHKVGAVAVVDAAQGAGHLGVNVEKLNCDFLGFSSHKIFGPTGVGILYGKRNLLEKMSPVIFGGDMVKEVQQKDATWNDLPWKFEAGTPNIADVIAFKAALEYMQQFDFTDILEHERKLLRYARQKLSELSGIQLLGPSVENACSILSFNIPGVHPHDVGSIVNEEGVAVRTGHHCAQPLMQRLGLIATVRMSFSLYNGEEDIDTAFEALQKVYKIFYGSLRREHFGSLQKSSQPRTTGKSHSVR